MLSIKSKTNNLCLVKVYGERAMQNAFFSRFGQSTIVDCRIRQHSFHILYKHKLQHFNSLILQTADGFIFIYFFIWLVELLWKYEVCILNNWKINKIANFLSYLIYLYVHIYAFQKLEINSYHWNRPQIAKLLWAYID